jgi:hypothetical protein
VTLRTYLAIYEHGRLVWEGDDRPPEERARVMVTVVESLLDGEDEDREAWIALSGRGLVEAYGPDEPVYTLDDVRFQ